MPPPAPSGTWFPINFDASALWFKYFFVNNTGQGQWLDKDKVKTIDLAPGSYWYWSGAGQTPYFTFTVTPAGTVQYDPAYGAFLSGAGTTTLTLIGYPVHIDASRLSGLGIVLDNSFYNGRSGGGMIQNQTVNLLPQGGYAMEQGWAMTTSFYFNLGLDGKISYSSAFTGYASGNGTSTLTLRGYPVCVDARPAGVTASNAMWEPGAFLTYGGPVQLYRLLPQTYDQWLNYPGGGTSQSCMQFKIADDGTISSPQGAWPSWMTHTNTSDYPLLTINQQHPC